MSYINIKRFRNEMLSKFIILNFLFFFFLISCRTPKTLFTKQEVHDTLTIFEYKNKTLDYGFLTWKGFEFDSSLTPIPYLATRYPEYKLVSFNNFRNQKRISYAYYFSFRTHMLVFELPISNPKNAMLKRKKQIKGRKYDIISEDIYLQDKHPIYVLTYNQLTKKDTFYCCEFYLNAPKHTLRFIFFKINPSYSKGYESYLAFSMMMKSFHWLGEKNFYNFLN